MIVGCLPPFKSLFSSNPSQPTGYYSTAYNGSLPLQSHATARGGWKDEAADTSRESVIYPMATEPMYPLQKIMVKTDVVSCILLPLLVGWLQCTI